MLRLPFTFILVLGISAPAGTDSPQALEVVPFVDLSRYSGKWYEIARLPFQYQKNCAGEVTATYSLLEGNRVKVVNECRLTNGRMNRAEGEARIAGKGGPTSKLEVRFAPSWLSWLPMVWGDYWVIELAPDYSYSVVGTPDRKYLWILSRTPQMGEQVYQGIIKRAAAKGFNVEKVVKTSQQAPSSPEK